MADRAKRTPTSASGSPSDPKKRGSTVILKRPTELRAAAARETRKLPADESGQASDEAHESTALPIEGLSLAVKFTLIISATFVVILVVFGFVVNRQVRAAFDREIDGFGASLVSAIATADPGCWSFDHGTYKELIAEINSFANSYPDFLAEMTAFRRDEDIEPVHNGDPNQARLGPAGTRQREALETKHAQRSKANEQRLMALLSHAAEDGTRVESEVGKAVVAELGPDKMVVERSAPIDAGIAFSAGSAVARRFEIEDADGVKHSTPIEIQEGQDGRDRVRLYSAPVTDATGKVTHKAFVLLRERAIEDKISAITMTFFVMTVIFILVGAGVSFFVTKRMTSPLTALVRDIEVVASGDFDHRTKSTSTDEIGLLAQTFDEMTLSLREAQELERQNLALRHDVGVASEIQSKLLPEKIPVVPGIEIDAVHRGTADVGGDYYDFVPLEGGKIGFVVSGLSGRGVPAAMLSTMARSLLRAEMERSTSPGEILRRVNRSLARDIRKGMYVTIVTAVFDPATKSLVIANAGHNALLLFRGSGPQAVEIHPDGIALGLDSGAIFDKTLKEETVELAPGDRVVLFTEGAYKTTNAAGEEFGRERFVEMLGQNAKMNSSALVNIVAGRIDRFRGDAPAARDVTIVTLKALP